jgi:hypothetical protein
MYLSKAVVPYKPVSTPFPIQPTYAQKVAVSSNAFMNAMNSRPQTLQVRPSYNVPIATMTTPSGQKLVQYNPTGAYYPVMKQVSFAPMIWPNMVGLHGYPHGPQQPEYGLGATISTGATGASIGTAIMPGIGTAIGALIGAGAGLISGKAHYSPWNFLYDDYPQHIYENEVIINGVRNAIARYTGAPQLPDPPMYQKKGGPQYQASMLAIVPKYSPGSETQIAAYDRRLNEAGGAYENTIKAQIALAPQLQNELQNWQQRGQPLPTSPQPASPTAVAPYGGPYPAPFQAPQTQPYSTSYQPPPLLPQYQPGPTMLPSPNISITSPGGSAPQLSDMFGGAMSGYMPYVIGAVGLAFILMQQKGGTQTRTVYRTAPRRRRK